MNLGNNERRLLGAMLSKPSKQWTLEELLSVTGWTDQVHVAGAGKALEDEGLVEVEESRITLLSLGEQGSKALAAGLLESRLWEWISNQSTESRNMNELLSSGFDRSETGPGIGVLKGLGVSIVSGSLVAGHEDEVSESIRRRTEFIHSLEPGYLDSSKLDSELVEHFSSRGGLIEMEESVTRTWKLTDSG